MRETAPNLIESCEKLVTTMTSMRETVVESYDDLIATLGAVRTQHGLYEGVFSGSKDGIFVLDPDNGGILGVNKSACEMLGYAQDDLEGRSIMDLHPKEDVESMRAAVAHTREHGSITGLAGRFIRKDGTVMPASISSHIVRDAEGERIVGFVRDESKRSEAEEKMRALNADLGEKVKAKEAAEQELRELNENLEKRVQQRTEQMRKANEELEKTIDRANRLVLEAREATRAKSAFIAHMTHELRTPLNAVIGMSELLLDMELGDEQRETAGIVANSAKSLLGVITEVLDFSKIEAGKFDLEHELFNPHEVLQSVADTFAYQLREKGLEFSQDVAPELPAALEGDAGRVRQILVNLVGNALKFTAEGGVTIKASVTDSGPEETGLRFEVIDTGVGIAPEKVEGLFDAFNQADASTCRNYGGTGLGLTISRQLAEMMGGGMGVDSTVGQGSTFWFTARFGRASASRLKTWQAAERKPAASGPSLKTDLRILMVEDNKVNQRVALGMLSKLGYTAECADGGLEGLQLLKDNDYDLVFMDVQMPGMGGLEVVERLRKGDAGERNRAVPIVALTAHATRQDRRMCLDAGMDDYVAKPIGSDRLAEAMERALSPRRREAGADGDHGFSMRELIDRMDGDLELATEILDVFLADTAERLKSAKGAAQNYDFAFVVEEARAIEGGALNVKAELAVNLARELASAAMAKQQENCSALVDQLRHELEQIKQVT